MLKSEGGWLKSGGSPEMGCSHFQIKSQIDASHNPATP